MMEDMEDREGCWPVMVVYLLGLCLVVFVLIHFIAKFW